MVDFAVVFSSLIFGFFLGSFLMVVVDRLYNGESIVFGRSHCDHCKKNLSFPDLIPLVSFLVFRGRCRYCKKNLSFYYPVSEAVTGIGFLLFAVYNPYFPAIQQNQSILNVIIFYIFPLILIGNLIIIFLSDLKYGYIPFISIVLCVFVSAVILVFNHQNIQSHIISSLGAGGFFLFVYLVTRKRGIGLGDVVYGFFMGFLLGFPEVIPAFYITFLTACFVAIILILARKKKFRGSSIPLGPFLVLGTYVLFVWGDAVSRFMISKLLGL